MTPVPPPQVTSPLKHLHWLPISHCVQPTPFILTCKTDSMYFTFSSKSLSYMCSNKGLPHEPTSHEVSTSCLHVLTHAVPSAQVAFSPSLPVESYLPKSPAPTPSTPLALTKWRQDKSHAYRYFHFKLISIVFNANVSERPLDEARWTKDEYELQVAWKRHLEGSRKASGRISHPWVSSCLRLQTTKLA